VDWATEYDSKEFYTFKTPAGNVFYLIIDHAKSADNVYFLSAVTEQDLLALAEQAGKSSGSTSSIPTAEPPSEQPDQQPAESENKSVAPKNDAPPKKSGSTGFVIFVLIGVLAVGGAMYYIKVVRPKKQANNDNEDDDMPNEGNEGSDTEMEFDDEPEDDEK
jgi:hypothetical protein